MKVLVIGGTLFIGRLLVDELIKAGHEVAVLHRKPKHDLGRKVENLMADRNDADSMKEALAGRRFEVVYDNAYDWNAAPPRRRSRLRSASSRVPG
jgi:nucleoside-diphosphate-sugar epimerase